MIKEHRRVSPLHPGEVTEEMRAEAAAVKADARRRKLGTPHLRAPGNSPRPQVPRIVVRRLGGRR